VAPECNRDNTGALGIPVVYLFNKARHRNECGLSFWPVILGSSVGRVMLCYPALPVPFVTGVTTLWDGHVALAR